MRSPNAFVVAVRKSDGSIRLRRDQWFGFSNKFSFLKKPFLRGVITLFEAMANGIVSLNYSANVAMDGELRQEALRKGQTLEEYESAKAKSESVDWGTFLAIILSLGFGVSLFVLAPHAATVGISQVFSFNWSLDGFVFHLVDGSIKASIFVAYVWLIGFVPDIKRVFQYHGAEHKSISAFEAGEELLVENAKKFSTLHPRCGTSFMFFLLFISIIIFSGVFSVIPIGEGLPLVLKHLSAIGVKVLFMFPVAGISYEVIKLAGKYPNNIIARFFSFPGMLLQRLTTREPDSEQLEVALCSMRAALALEDKFNLKEANSKVLNMEEVDIHSLVDIQESSATLKDFLEQ